MTRTSSPIFAVIHKTLSRVNFFIIQVICAIATTANITTPTGTLIRRKIHKKPPTELPGFGFERKSRTNATIYGAVIMSIAKM